MTRGIVSTVAGLAFGLCVAAGLVSPAASEPAAWDQARVSSIAQQLADAGTAWEAAVLRQPEAGPRMQLNARTLREQSTMLAAHLGKGEGRDRTVDYYRGLREVVDDTEELSVTRPARRAQHGRLGEGRGSHASDRSLLLSGGTPAARARSSAGRRA